MIEFESFMKLFVEFNSWLCCASCKSNYFPLHFELDAGVYSQCSNCLILQFQIVSLYHAFLVVVGIVSIARMFSRKTGMGNMR